MIGVRQSCVEHCPTDFEATTVQDRGGRVVWLKVNAEKTVMNEEQYEFHGWFIIDGKRVGTFSYFNDNRLTDVDYNVDLQWGKFFVDNYSNYTEEIDDWIIETSYEYEVYAAFVRSSRQ